MIRIKICCMFVSLLVSIVSGLNHRIKNVGKDLIRLLIPSHYSIGEDKWVSWVVNSGLDSSIKREAIGCLDWSKLSVNIFCQTFCNVAVMI